MKIKLPSYSNDLRITLDDGTDITKEMQIISLKTEVNTTTNLTSVIIETYADIEFDLKAKT